MVLGSEQYPLMLCPRSIVINISIYRVAISIRHSRAGGNPVDFELDSRLRGSDNHFVAYLQGTTLGSWNILEMPNIEFLKCREMLP
jgi:hypothetical protein